MLRYKAMWDVPGAGPAVSTFHMLGSLGGPDLATLAGHYKTFFEAIKAALPNEVSVAFDSQVDEIDPITGLLTGSDPVAPPAPTIGTFSGSWAGGAGFRLMWGTGVIRNGRRVVGSTFIVPMASTSFDSTGHPSAGTVATVNTAATALIANLGSLATPLVIWSRPAGAVPGAMSSVAQGAVSQVTGSLRSRKY